MPRTLPAPSAEQLRAYETAKLAVQRARKLRPQWEAFARMLTGKSDLRVILSTEISCTDGKNIYLKVPAELATLPPHDSGLCGRRDSDSVQRCPACRVLEYVDTVTFHEVAHIAFDSFEVATETDVFDLVSKAIVLDCNGKADSARARAITQRFEEWKNDGRRSRTYGDLAALVNQFLPLLLNAVEDMRVNREMQEARPGTRVMFSALYAELMERGQVRYDGSIVKWSEQPKNAQAMIGVFCRVSEFPFEKWLAPEVTADMNDPEIVDLCEQFKACTSVRQMYRLTFPLLEALRRLGYMRMPDEPEDEPPAPNTQPESTEDKGDSDDTETNEENDAADQDADSDDSEGGAGDSQESDPAQPDEADDEADGQSAPEGGEPEGGSEGDDQGGDASPDELDDGSTDEAPDDGGDADSDDLHGAEGDSEGSDDPSGQPDEAGTDDDGAGEPAPVGDEGELSDGDDDDESGSPEAGDDPSPASEGDDADAGPSSEDSDDGDASPGSADASEPASDDGDAPDGDDSADGSSDGERPTDGSPSFDAPGSGEGDGSSDASPGDSQDEPGGSSDASDAGEPDPVEGEGPSDQADGTTEDDPSEGVSTDDPGPDTGADGADTPDDSDASDTASDGATVGDDIAPEAPTPAPYSQDDLDQDGTPEEVEQIFKTFSGHADELDSPDERAFNPTTFVDPEKEALEEAIDMALRQMDHFDAPSLVVRGVDEVHFDPERGVGSFSPRHYEEVTISETILQPSLAKLRMVFTQNRARRNERNLRKGKLDTGKLGRRAPVGDDRIFQKRTIPSVLSHFVLIGLDVSGSTAQGNRLRILKESSMAMAELLNRLGIDFAVYAHTGGVSHAAVGIYVIKEPGERWTDETRRRLCCLRPSSANLDGHTLEFYRKVAQRSRADKRLVLYYTDGDMPLANFDEELEILQREIEVLRRLNIDLVGIGVHTDSPTQHGLKTIELNSVEDTPLVVTELRRYLGG